MGVCRTKEDLLKVVAQEKVSGLSPVGRPHICRRIAALGTKQRPATAHTKYEIGLLG